MKKIISLVLVLMTLSACSGKTEVIPRLVGISFTADMTYFNENYKGDCVISPDGTLACKITEPESLSGYTVTLSKDGMTAEYLGITYTPTESNMPFSGVIGEFYEKLGTIIASGSSAQKKDDAYIIKGGEDADAYALYMSSTGLPQSLQLPDERFTVYFYNTTVLNEQ